MMNSDHEVAAFAQDLAALCDRYSQEFDLSTAAAIGVLLIQIRMLEDELLDRFHGDTDPERN